MFSHHNIRKGFQCRKFRKEVKIGYCLQYHLIKQKKWSLNKPFYTLRPSMPWAPTFIIHRWWPSADRVKQVRFSRSNMTVIGFEDQVSCHFFFQSFFLEGPLPGAASWPLSMSWREITLRVNFSVKTWNANRLCCGWGQGKAICFEQHKWSNSVCGLPSLGFSQCSLWFS